MRFHRSLLLCLALSATAQTPIHTSCCGPITPAGEHLARVLDSMDVEHH